MKKIIFVWLTFFSLLLTAELSLAQAPNLSTSYTLSPYVYGVGATVSLSPVNTGGAVPATIFGTVSTFAGGPPPTPAAGTTNNTGTLARFNTPRGVIPDGAGNF